MQQVQVAKTQPRPIEVVKKRAGGRECMKGKVVVAPFEASHRGSGLL
jgi:hypothetical protein